MKYMTFTEEMVDFDNGVNELIKEGWKPIGGVAVEKYGYSTHYTQALIKEDEE